MCGYEYAHAYTHACIHACMRAYAYAHIYMDAHTYISITLSRPPFSPMDRCRPLIIYSPPLHSIFP